MKISTLLSENDNYKSQLINDINVYLVRLKANDINTIGTDIMVRELNDLGHSITPESLIDMLSNSKYVSNVSLNSIDLEFAPTSNKDDDSRDTVKKLASKATSRRMK
jgi:hypothetical protein